jgi:hypothetical protein
MRLTVGRLPAGVYWRRRAAVAVALALAVVLIVFATTHIGRDPAAPTSQPTLIGSPRPPEPTASATGSTAPTTTTGSAGSSGPDPSTGPPANTGGGGGNVAPPPVVATVPCTDAEIRVTTAVSPSPGVYGGIITLTLIVRNTADHACLRDVGSAQQELQVRQGGTLLWSSDHCNPPPGISDVRAFGPNIETRFWRTWNPYKVAPNECDPPAGALPAGAGTYQVAGRLGSKVSEPTTFEIRV